MEEPGASTAGTRTSLSFGRDLRVAVVPWVLARVLVLGTLVAYRLVETGAARPIPLRQGLFAWDAAFYRGIAEHGYGAAQESLRFFPLVPLLARWLGVVLLGNDALALLVIANGSALLFGALLHRLALRETGDEGVARRSAWFAALFPTAFVLVLGYAEATMMLLAVVAFLAFRRDHWVTGAGASFLAALARPVGVLLAAPAAVEGLRGWRGATASGRAARVLAVVAAPAGLALYLWWADRAYGDFFLPLRLQNDDGLRGGFQDPVSRIFEGLGDLLGGDKFGSGLHILWAALFVALVVVLARRLAVSYAIYAGGAVLLGLSAQNLDSFERYGMSTFPLLLALALVTGRRRVEQLALLASAAGLVVYTALALRGTYVP